MREKRYKELSKVYETLLIEHKATEEGKKVRPGFEPIHKHLCILISYMEGLKEYDYQAKGNDKLILGPSDKPIWCSSIDVLRRLEEITSY